MQKALSVMGGTLKMHRVLCCVIAKRKTLSAHDGAKRHIGNTKMIVEGIK